mmetsp:Transcript_54868/g.119997  ORF Transcript_54868/g.119997 Transcript_54868/m.119997 type:complete len:584 (-) Transcript_54868:29-1780(-)
MNAQIPRLPCAIVKEWATFQQEDGLSEEYLKHYCGVEDLSSVNRLEIQVDSVKQSVEPLGDCLPNLKHLKLVQSSLLCIRDLGTSLQNLEVLWISRCGLQDLAGAVSALPNLRELYMPFNDVSDLAILGGHETLEVLDVEGNAITDACEVSSLSSCRMLRELSILGNPVVKPGKGSLTREAIIDMLPQLMMLDDMSTDPNASLSSTRPAGDDEDDDADDLDALFLTPEDLEDLDFGNDHLHHATEKRSRRTTAGDEAFDAGSSDDDSCSIESIAEGPRNGIDQDELTSHNDDGTRIKPLKAKHPALAAALQQAAGEEGSSKSSARYSNEPDEDDLVTERLKQVRFRDGMPHAHTARPAVGWFNFQMYDRRQIPESEPASFRPGTGSGFRPGTASSARPATSAGTINFESLAMSQDGASSLTVGEALAGGARALMRHRRERRNSYYSNDGDNAETGEGGAGGASPSDGRVDDLDIRELLRRYQTFTQPSCLGKEELAQLKLDAMSRRPGSRDFRIHTLSTDPPGSAQHGRPGSGGYPGDISPTRSSGSTRRGSGLPLAPSLSGSGRLSEPLKSLRSVDILDLSK